MFIAFWIPGGQMEVGREMGGSFVPWWQKVSRKPCATMAESMDGSPCAMVAQSIFRNLVS